MVFYRQSKVLIAFLFLGNFFSAIAEDVPSYKFVKISDFRVQILSKEDYAKNKLYWGKGTKWYWTSLLENAYKVTEAYKNKDGGFVFYSGFNCGPLPENSTPILMLNHLAPNSKVKIGPKFLKQILARQHGDNKFDIEYWYEIPKDVLNISKDGWNERHHNNRVYVWTPEIIKENKPTTPTLSKIVFENPDVIAKREKERKLQYPYLYPVTEDEDPYVARHW